MGQQCMRDACDRPRSDQTEVTFQPPKSQQQSYQPVGQSGSGQPQAGFEDQTEQKPTVDIFVTKDELGRRQGFGRIEELGYQYEGQFRDDFKEGQGILTWPDGRQYQGQFVGGKFHGKAVMVWADGRRYEGEYVYGRKHGYGVFTWPDGRKYQGEWFDGRRHGKGTYTNAKRETRTGYWENDRPTQWDPVAGDASQIPTVRSNYQQ